MLKRAMDLIGATILLLIVSPVMLVCAIAIKAESPGSALFRHLRIGRGGRPFTLYKLRSMRSQTSAHGPQITVSGDSRITRVGRLLRKTKLDELPQLWNVVRGDMSLVGPRPEVAQYVAGYTAGQRVVLNWKPGITSPSSLRFIDEESVLASAASPDQLYRREILPRKLAIDIAYCSRASALTDLALLGTTFIRILTSSRRVTAAADRRRSVSSSENR